MKHSNYPVLLVLVLALIFCSCAGRSSKQITYYENGKIKSVIINNAGTDKLRIELSFYENGEVKEIHRLNQEGQFQGEQLWFYNDGILDRKIPVQNGLAGGNAYYFYDTTGTLNGHRYFRMDKEVSYGADYWEDSLGIIKSSLLFNDSGQVIDAKFFDKNGHFVREEGKK
ncbi:toxin-antitoxin system YwqK family antitoxin [Ferruginibacter sp.]